MPEETLVSVSEAARRLAVSERQLRHLIDKGALEVVRLRLAGARRAVVAVRVSALGTSSSHSTSHAE